MTMLDTAGTTGGYDKEGGCGEKRNRNGDGRGSSGHVGQNTARRGGRVWKGAATVVLEKAVTGGCTMTVSWLIERDAGGGSIGEPRLGFPTLGGAGGPPRRLAPQPTPVGEADPVLRTAWPREVPLAVGWAATGREGETPHCIEDGVPGILTKE